VLITNTKTSLPTLVDNYGCDKGSSKLLKIKDGLNGHQLLNMKLHVKISLELSKHFQLKLPVILDGSIARSISLVPSLIPLDSHSCHWSNGTDAPFIPTILEDAEIIIDSKLHRLVKAVLLNN